MTIAGGTQCPGIVVSVVKLIESLLSSSIASAMLPSRNRSEVGNSSGGSVAGVEIRQEIAESDTAVSGKKNSMLLNSE